MPAEAKAAIALCLLGAACKLWQLKHELLQRLRPLVWDIMTDHCAARVGVCSMKSGMTILGNSTQSGAAINGRLLGTS